MLRISSRCGGGIGVQRGEVPDTIVCQKARAGAGEESRWFRRSWIGEWEGGIRRTRRPEAGQSLW